MVVLSFCIPVYNQWKLVKSCIDSIIEYRETDIEIIISDDCSSDDIESLVNEYGDKRIKYFRNRQNLGHDLNIIASFKRANGKFAFLLRTRDRMIASSIKTMIEQIQLDDKISYMTGSAKDENGRFVFQYKNRRYKKGEEALKAHMGLYVHPSGSAYRLRDLKLDQIEIFLKENMETKYSFIAHNLMRVPLSQTGDFMVIEKPVWIYTNTSRAKDIAVNSSKNNVSVYSSGYSNLRYQCEMIWAGQVLGEEYRSLMYRHLFRAYLNQATWLNQLSNRDHKLQYHYNFKPIRVSIGRERKQFLQLTKKLEGSLPAGDCKNWGFILMIKREVLYNMTTGALKYFVLRLTNIAWVAGLVTVINKKRYGRRLIK